MALCPKIFLVVYPNCVPNLMLLSSNPQSFHISAALSDDEVNSSEFEVGSDSDSDGVSDAGNNFLVDQPIQSGRVPARRRGRGGGGYPLPGSLLLWSVMLCA